VICGYCDRLAEPQFEVLERHVAALGAVGLVHGEDGRLVGPPEHRRGLEISRGRARHDVRHQHDDIGFSDRRACLRPGLLGDVGLGRFRRLRELVVFLQTAGVDHRELDPRPVGRAIDAIARRTRLVLDDRAPLADQAVEQGGFPNVRTSDDGDDGLCHLNSICQVSAARQTLAVGAEQDESGSGRNWHEV
jgi:hypothetical protein